MPKPQAFQSSYAPRLRGHLNSLLTPVIPPSISQNAPASRTTKRGTVVINYSEDLLNDEDLDESDGPRRPTGLRSRRDDPNQGREALVDRLGKELTAPVEIQGIWRDWMGKPKFTKTDKQLHAQSSLPLTLIPIRIDLDIPSFIPAPALPLPVDAQAFGINPSLPAYKTPEPTPAYRLKDLFLWNLHETLITPEQFALVLVHELDLPNPNYYAMAIGNQIRQQLEEYAGVALHPLFRSSGIATQNETGVKRLRSSVSRDPSEAPIAPMTAFVRGGSTNTVLSNGLLSAGNADHSVTATARPHDTDSPPDIHNPDDTYRCIVTLNINLLNKLYTDRFEWSLLHPPGIAEIFARRTCADIGLTGEWIPAMTHAIYEAVLRLKKETCESGGLGGGVANDSLAANGGEAGWRYDPEHLADEWEPKVETLSKEEIEKREGDRERQVRRQRRETARFSSTTNMTGVVPTGAVAFDAHDSAETPMGRGERSKKKRRFRSLSPPNRGATPGGTTEAAGYGGGGGLTDWERQSWRCSHCMVHGSAVWTVRDGPSGPRSLCNNCGLIYEREKRLSPWSKDLHRMDVPVSQRRE